MITKESLLDMLRKSLSNEDTFIGSYGKEFLEGVTKIKELNEDEKKEIKDLLTVLLEDTRRHSDTIKSLIKDVEEGGKNEY